MAKARSFVKRRKMRIDAEIIEGPFDYRFEKLLGPYPQENFEVFYRDASVTQLVEFLRVQLSFGRKTRVILEGPEGSMLVLMLEGKRNDSWRY